MDVLPAALVAATFLWGLVAGPTVAVKILLARI